MSVLASRKASESWFSRHFATLLISPTLLIIFLVCIFPLAYSLVLSFYSYEMVSPLPMRFVSLKNYWSVLQDKRFWHAASISLITVGAGVLLQLVLGFASALFLNKEFWGRSALVSIFLIPTTIAPVVVGFVWRMILNDRYGPLNYFLRMLGLPPVPWLADPKAAVGGIILANSWEWFPFMMLVLLAGLHSIPGELTDAAKVDGASDWQVFWHVILPLLRSIILVLILIRAIEDFKLFDVIYVTTGGGPGIATETMNMYAYQRGFSFFSIGYASALSYVQMILTLIMVRVLFGRLSR